MSEEQCPDRKRPVHLPSMAKGNRSSIQFVTVCVKERRPILDNERVHTLLRELWSDSSVFMVGRYVIMPDHIHLFCAPNALPSPSLKPWVAILEIAFREPSEAGAGREVVATRVLGPRIAFWRKLFGEVGLCVQ